MAANESVWHHICHQVVIWPYSCGIVCLTTKIPKLTSFSIMEAVKAYVIGMADKSWVGVFQLTGKRYACVRGAYDPKKGFALGIEAEVSCYLAELIRFGLTEAERRLLDLTLPEDEMHKI